MRIHLRGKNPVKIISIGKKVQRGEPRIRPQKKWLPDRYHDKVAKIKKRLG